MSSIQENRGLFPGAYNAGNDYREDDGMVRDTKSDQSQKANPKGKVKK